MAAGAAAADGLGGVVFHPPGGGAAQSTGGGSAGSVPGATAAPGAGGGAGAGAPGPDLDDLARRLFDPLSARIKSELWLDRERAGMVTDLAR